MFNDPDYVFGDQNVSVPAHLNFGKFILQKLLKYGNNVALENTASGEKCTYKELAQFAVNLSVSLSNLGVKKGDIVALGTEKRNEYISIVYGIILCGATYTSYEVQCGRATLKHKIGITKPKFFICSKTFWDFNKETLQTFDSFQTIIALDDGFDDAIPMSSLIKNQDPLGSLSNYSLDMDLFEPANVQGQIDTAIILYSSGTTGLPKGVMLTHLNCIIASLPDQFNDENLKVAWIFGEWYHNYDIFMTSKFLAGGKKIVYYPYDYQIDVVVKNLHDYKVNIAFLVPSAMAQLSKYEEAAKYNFDSLKVIYSRSAPLHIKTIEEIKKRFPSVKNILQGYGMSESGELTSESWGAKGTKIGSVGHPAPGITMKVVNVKTRNVLGPNQQGEICLRGPVFMKGYIGIDQATYTDKQGFFLTGDLGYYDEDKYFFIVDRIKEIISYDGYKIAPLELETILLLHPGVREAGVVGKPEREYGELPTAFVVRQPGSTVTEQELKDYVASEVSHYMELKGGVKFIDSMPRNPRGKLLRKNLREMLEKDA